MRWPDNALEPFSIFVHAMPADAQQGFLQQSVQCSSQNTASPEEIEKIAGFLGAQKLSVTAKASGEFMDALGALSSTFPSLLGLLSAIKAFKKSSQEKENPSVSQMAFKFCSMGGEDVTPTLAFMRDQSAAMTVEATQTQ
jgi:hypothetical protein